MTFYIMVVISIAIIIALFIIIAIVLNRIFKRLKAVEESSIPIEDIWFVLRKYYVNLADYRISEEDELKDYLEHEPGHVFIRHRYAEKVVAKTRKEYDDHRAAEKVRRIVGTEQIKPKSIT